MKITIDVDQVETYAYIVKTLGYQCTAYQDGLFCFDVASVDFIDFYDVVFDSKNNTLIIYDSSYSADDMEKIYSIVGYCKFNNVEVILK